MRYEFNLDREWQFHLGDVETAALKSHSDSYSASKAGGERGVPNPGYDSSDWRVVDLPHDYFTETPFHPDNLMSHGYRTRCNAWYRKTFRLPAELAGKHVFLSFEGMAVTARVYLNGSVMGRSFSAYAPLDIDITDRAYFGDRVNTLAVYIDGLTTEGWWYEGAGIYRHVKLYVKEPLHIAHDGLWIKPIYDKTTANDWKAVCEATVENTGYMAKEYAIRAEIFDGDRVIACGESEVLTCPADSRTAASVTLEVKNPRLWDVESPELYPVKITLLENGEPIDADSTRIGFRTFTADKDRGFFLNGRPIKLMGTCNHQDHAGVGVAVPDSVQYYRIRRLKEMGTNAYRCSHNMPSRAVLDACDELGLLVMDENRRFESRPEVLGHVEAMVRRDRNHPSVVMYSLFNEEPLQGTEEGGRIFRRMRSVVDKLDDTRLITGAMNGGYSDADGAAAYMDVTGINYNVPDGVLGYREHYPDRPIVGSENNSAVSTRGCFRTDADRHVLDCYDEKTVPWGQLIRTTWKFTREHDWFGGIFIWTGFDYRGEPTPYTSWPSIGSQFGIMDTCGFPKASFWQNRVCFTKVPEMHLIPHWNWKVGETVRVMPISNCEETELFLNGRSLGRKASDVCDLPVWEVPFEPGRISATGYNGGVAVASAECVTAGAPLRVLLIPDRPYLYNDGMDAIPLTVCVADADGNILETADNKIHFEIIGDGVLLGVGNGDPNCLESDHEPERSLYAGYAQAIVQTKPGAKALTVRAHADGLESAETVLEIRETEQPAYIYAAVSRSVGGFSVTSETFTEKPDALAVIADSDMNSLEPVTFDPWSVKPGFTAGYKYFRAFVRTARTANPDAQGRCEIVIRRLAAESAAIWAAGNCLFDGAVGDQPLTVSFACDPDTEYELRILVKADGEHPCGIAGGVEMRMY